MSREEIKIGDRVRLIRSDNKFTLLKPGDLGTVWNITTFSLMDEQKIRQVWIQWDNNIQLALLEGIDRFKCRTHFMFDNNKNIQSIYPLLERHNEILCRSPLPSCT